MSRRLAESGALSRGRVGHVTRVARVALLVPAMLGGFAAPARAEPAPQATPSYSLSPVGWIRKSDGKTFIVIDERYRAALMGVEELASIWVLWWFDRNDSPAQRSVLQVHPRGDPQRPLRGVFATRSPLRPNLIAMSQVKVLSVRDNVVEIDAIDAFPDTPVLDLKP